MSSEIQWVIGVTITIIGMIGGAIAWSVLNFAPKTEVIEVKQQAAQHLPVAEYEKHLENEESRYVLALKRQIRELRKYVREHPDDEFARGDLEDAIAVLCEIRPDDKLCVSD